MREALAALQPPNARYTFASRSPDRPKALNLLGTLARYPALARAYNTFNGHVQLATSLSMRQRELLVLRIAAVRGCEYEWAQHVFLAGDAGLSSDEIARVSRGAYPEGWSPLEGALLKAVDELIAGAKVSEATWQSLASELDVQQMMDVVFTVGAYDALAMAMLSFAVELDDDLRT